jgi:hypothetical protein
MKTEPLNPISGVCSFAYASDTAEENQNKNPDVIGQLAKQEFYV